jgi:hypothetical protein
VWLLGQPRRRCCQGLHQLCLPLLLLLLDGLLRQQLRVQQPLLRLLRLLRLLIVGRPCRAGLPLLPAFFRCLALSRAVPSSSSSSRPLGWPLQLPAAPLAAALQLAPAPLGRCLRTPPLVELAARAVPLQADAAAAALGVKRTKQVEGAALRGGRRGAGVWVAGWVAGGRRVVVPAAVWRQAAFSGRRTCWQKRAPPLGRATVAARACDSQM